MTQYDPQDRAQYIHAQADKALETVEEYVGKLASDQKEWLKEEFIQHLGEIVEAVEKGAKK
ncbi:hypothetical protein [Streptomyces chrestomyceticus]|uniref:hypothetical protein n=1 Tax=Streptomyces chrestomyceticus TaxID=68185 RepID=UPI00378E8904